MRLYGGQYSGRDRFESEAYALGYHLIAGADEAGRGPLAGPMVMAACILPPDFRFPGVDDSKKLSAKRREALAEQIREEAIAYAHVSYSPAEIERLNIYQAARRALSEVIKRLDPCADYLIADALSPDSEIGIPFLSLTHGDALSVSVAAASILAKVHRDQFMTAAAEIYPDYGFEKHKGYGTAAHYEALNLYGPTPLHRPTFLRSWFKRQGIDPEHGRHSLLKQIIEEPHFHASEIEMLGDFY
ncbi:MAG: ribonuclease HII [Eubacteriales bacterium]|nr:ribonuclease HII [Eubacteriales bacterium]